MKNDVLMYEKVYEILKNKIKCGLIPAGTRLPSRALLCREFGISEKTIRHALQMLVEEGLVQSSKRKRPVVVSRAGAEGKEELQEADAAAAEDILKASALLCYPVCIRGMRLCRGEDWKIPEAIMKNMDLEDPMEFWKLSNRLWRFFIARNENELILRVVDSLGFSELDFQPATLDIRKRYLQDLQRFLLDMKRGGNPEKVNFKDVTAVYGFYPAQYREKEKYRVAADSLLCVGMKELEPRMRRAQERYSSVCMDLLGLIAVGRYQPGERLPSHTELRKIYGVSIDTTIKAIGILQEWGIVNTVRGRGIFVAMDLQGLKKIQYDPKLLACHVRRYLDSLELLSFTVEGVAAHAAAHAAQEEIFHLREHIEYYWGEGYLYQCSPSIVLDFIVKHIQYDSLKAIYEIVWKNYHIGRSIPRLVTKEKTPGSCEIYGQCIKAAELLEEGRVEDFAKMAALMFQNTQRMIQEVCKELGYWDIAMNMYDGKALWK